MAVAIVAQHDALVLVASSIFHHTGRNGNVIHMLFFCSKRCRLISTVLGSNGQRLAADTGCPATFELHRGIVGSILAYTDSREGVNASNIIGKSHLELSSLTGIQHAGIDRSATHMLDDTLARLDDVSIVVGPVVVHLANLCSGISVFTSLRNIKREIAAKDIVVCVVGISQFRRVASLAGDRSQLVTVHKGTVVNILDTGGDDHRGQFRARSKTSLVDKEQTLGQHDLLQLGAGKGLVANISNSVGQRDMLQRCLDESIVPDDLDTIAQLNSLDFATPEGTAEDSGTVQLHLRDTRHRNAIQNAAILAKQGTIFLVNHEVRVLRVNDVLRDIGLGKGTLANLLDRCGNIDCRQRNSQEGLRANLLQG